MNKRISQLRALSIEQWGVLLLSLLLLPLVALSLQVFGLNKTRALMAGFTGTRLTDIMPKSEQLKIAQDTARMVVVAANHGLYPANCLKRSLLIWWLLARRGVTAEIKIGVRKSEDGFQAHAWVKFENTVLADSVGYQAEIKAFSANMANPGERH